MSALRQVATEIFRAAIASVDPARLVASHLVVDGHEVIVAAGDGAVRRWAGPTLVVGAGKAAAGMAAGCERVLGAGRVHGIVTVADGGAVGLERIEVIAAGHPLPDERSVIAARRLLDAVAESESGGILALIGGGASSLLAAPLAPVTLADKAEVSRLLLACGATITEFNTVRKHLSRVKGGGLLRSARLPMAGLLISDVVGDDPGTIGSGPTAPDPTTFSEALAVLRHHRLLGRIPRTVEELLQLGSEGRVPETVKPGSPVAARCRNIVVGGNRTAMEGAAAAARERGWEVLVEPESLQGDTSVAARQFAARVNLAARRRRAATPVCLIAGGETTVEVRGAGRGGRNQEFGLALALALTPEPGIEASDLVVLSAGTDGIDGPTDAAGAFVDGETLAQSRRRGLSAEAALRDNDSYAFFASLGALFRCGPTGTNVMDLKIALLPPIREPRS